MDRESIVYGCIKDLPFGNETEVLKRRYHNLRTIHSLPGGDEWPFLSPDFFSVSGGQPEQGTYITQIIHFGASYCAVECNWELWIKKFEAILKQMYWNSATVHLETELAGTHTFSWHAEKSYHSPDEDLLARCEWQHDGLLKTKQHA